MRRRSVINLIGTIFWIRSNKPFDAKAYEQFLAPEGAVGRLDQVIDWIENGSVLADCVIRSRDAYLVEEPVPTLETVYAKLGLSFPEEARTVVDAYLYGKPKHKLGTHHYTIDKADRTRALSARYQDYFDVPSEA